jgi:LmbE family N-acetylglucosaminyl deacetylase
MIRRILNKIESIYKYRYFSRNEKGAYHFLLKKIHKSTDIDFIERIWQLDYFREILEPQPLEMNHLKRVLVLAPHQDDELLGCGGTLLKLKEQGCDISIGFLTNGAELSDPETSVPIRQKEAAKVCASLKAEMRELGIDNISMKIEEDHIGKLVTWLDEEWDAIFAVWPVDQPPKHRLCSYMLGKALKRSNYEGPVNFYAVHTDLLPNFYTDISEVIESKQNLLNLYESQMKAQRLDHLSKGLDAWRSRFLKPSAKARYIETFMQIPAEAYSQFQHIFENAETERLFKAHEACIRSFDHIKKS